MSFLSELKRRNVLRVGTAYLFGAWFLIQVAETIFPLFGFGNTPARLVVILLSIAFVPTLIFSWVFEITPEGLKKEADVIRHDSISHVTGKRLDRIILVVLALAIGYFAFDKFVLDPIEDEQIAQSAHQEGRSAAFTESYGDKSIAVLPFVNMSGEPDQEYFSDGISEELLNLLSKIPELRVISRSSAFTFRDKNVAIPEIARILNVANVLEGSVRKAGNRVRITVQLIEARSDTHLWSETYDRTLNDIFAIQDEIATMVVGQLKITLLGATPKVQEATPEAYSLVLQARHTSRQQTSEGFEQSIALYERALALDPDYAAAWDGLATNYTNQVNYGLRPTGEGYTLARMAVDKALAIDPEYASAHDGLGWIAMAYENDLATAARHFERALILDPTNPYIIGNSASLLFSLGRLEQAIALEEYKNARDPVNPIGYANLGMSYLCADRWDEAIAAYQTALRLGPGYFGAHYNIGTALLLKGEKEAALEAMYQEDFEGYRLLGLAMVHHALNQTQTSDAVLEDLIKKYEQDAAYNIAYVLAYRNDADLAFEWLDKAVEFGDSGLSEIVVQPEFRNIHSDPRWLPFLESVGKSPEQLAAIEFKITLPK